METYLQLKNNKSEEYEVCVLCKSNTDIKRSQPVWKRKYYVEGAGQLCRRCYHIVYGKI